LVCRSSHVLDGFSGIDTVYSDADGTLVPEGAVEFPRTVVGYFKELALRGVETIIVTGKPLTEVEGLVRSLPEDSGVKFMFEKGAYILERTPDGTRQASPLLVSEEDTLAVKALKESFIESKRAIEASFGGRLTLGWGGQGTHKSMLSIDVLSGIPPEDYLQTTGPERDALKVDDVELLAEVASAVREFVRKYAAGWNFVNLGNANFEIAPGPVEKDAAIRKFKQRRGSEAMLVLGDSANDAAMFRLRNDPNMRAMAGLVLHRESALPLVEEVDCVSFGMANVSPHIRALLAARTPQDIIY
jgi:hydroxymethylpyrimidine pyrophosphatase-like HAD family hydrolase